MNELFRFLMMRPANLPAESDVYTLNAHVLQLDQGHGVLRRQAVALLASDSAVRAVADSVLGSAARMVPSSGMVT